MKNKDISFDQYARENLLKGIDQLTHAVKSTLGPAGRNVIIENEYHEPSSTKDGVTVAKAIKLKDPIKNMGAQLVKEAAGQTAEEAGDGTTTATILAHAIIKEGSKAMVTGANPIEVKRGIEEAVKDIVEQLKAMKKDVIKPQEIEQVGTISANNDSQIGKLLSEAMEQVGMEGVITVEEAKKNETSLEIVEGMQFDKGYLSPYFINNNANMQVELEDVSILITDEKLRDASKAFVGMLEKIITSGNPLLIVADDVDNAALATLVVNKARGTLSVCAVKAPEFGERKQAILEDLAILTNGTVLSKTKGMTLDKFDPEWLGTARYVTVNNKQTTIIDGAGETNTIKDRIDEIKKLIEKASSNYETEKLQERLAKLAGGVAILNIGAETEPELKEKKDRVDDALHATRAAVEEGIVPGGGIALMNIYKRTNSEPNFDNDDQRLGYNIVQNALREPFNVIMSNAGLNGEAIWERISNHRIGMEHDACNIGFDARTQKIVDMYSSGIIDPVKVTRIALEKAASIASLFLTTNAVISNVEDEEDDKAQGMPGMGGMM